MSWRAKGQRVGIWLARACRRRITASSSQRLIDLRATSEETPIQIRQTPSRLVSALTGRIRFPRQRSRTWRRRILLRKGARIHVDMVNQADACSLAILDTEGLVVCWYDGLPDRCTPVGEVVNRHVAQFYAPTHLAGVLACEHLRKASSQGRSNQAGWRRQPGGTAFWAITEITPFVLRDGRVQGFLHVIRTAGGPQQHTAVLAGPTYLYATTRYRSWAPCAARNGAAMRASTASRDTRSWRRMAHV